MTQCNSFISRYPGPYAIQAGTDGIDNTFDIRCRTTGKNIISSRYWEDEENALLIAEVVTLALEFARLKKRHNRVSESIKCKLDQFKTGYPGPYSHKAFKHGDDHAEIGVSDSTGGNLLIGFDTVPENSLAIADSHYISAALNRLYWPALAARNE